CAGAVFFSALSLADHWTARRFPDLAVLAEPAVWIPLLYLGLLSSVGAFLLINFMLGRLEAARAAVYTNLTTVVSVLAGVVVLGERIGWRQLLGGGLVVAGVWGANRFARRAVYPRNSNLSR
ncbi:MAG: EamA family transporter, partial [Bacteroidota bacterium]